MEPPAVWEQQFEVRAYEVDVRGRLAVATLCDWLQEAAGNHALALGWGMEDLAARGLTWVLSRLHVKLDARPPWRAVVRLSTWPTGVHRLFAVRDFRAENADGAEIATATSGWLLLKLASRRPVRPPEAVETLAAAAPGCALADDFPRLPSAEEGERLAVLEARFSDLDINRHVNNVALLRMVLDGMPVATLDSSVLAELEAEFKAEVALGDALEARVAPAGEGVLLHSLVRTSDGREVVRARTRWEPAAR